MSTEEKLNKQPRTTTPRKKKTTTSTETMKTKKTKSATSSNDQQIIDEVNQIIQEANDLYTKTTAKVGTQIDRIEKALTVIRSAFAKENIKVPDKLNKYINDVNKYRQLQARMQRHLDRINDDRVPIEQKVATIASMIELSNNIPETNLETDNDKNQ